MTDDQILAEAGFILQKRMQRKKFQPWLESDSAITEFVRIRFHNTPNEQFSVICLDARCRLIGAYTLFKGSSTQTSVYPRIVAQKALLSNASNVVLVHNHPADGPISNADVKLTLVLEQTLRVLDIRVLDHLIVTTFAVVSMREQGLFTPIP